MKCLCAVLGTHILIIVKKQGFSVFWGKGHDFADDAVISRRKVANGGRQIFKRNPLVDVAQPRASRCSLILFFSSRPPWSHAREIFMCLSSKNYGIKSSMM